MSEITANSTAPIQEQLQAKNGGRIRTVTLRQMDYGYVVEIGCKAFAIENTENLITNLARYINSPDTTEEEYYNGTLFQKQTA